MYAGRQIRHRRLGDKIALIVSLKYRNEIAPLCLTRKASSALIDANHLFHLRRQEIVGERHAERLLDALAHRASCKCAIKHHHNLETKSKARVGIGQ